MEAKEIFEANSRNVRELLSENGLGLYIPPYQRPYGWDKEKVSKLIEDTLHGYSELLDHDDSFTFLGTVITIHDINFTTVQPAVRPDLPGKVLTVIDGQQRLTTLLVFCIALHNQIALAHAKAFKGKTYETMSAPEQWLDGQSRSIIDKLEHTFVERQPFGDSPLYPRMIRSFDDQWARSKANAQYKSPIAYLTWKYAESIDQGKPVEFKPAKREGTIQGEDALVSRFLQVSRTLKGLNADGTFRDDYDALPSLKKIAANGNFQRALLNHDFPEDVCELLQNNNADADFKVLLQLLLVASYSLTRVALTVVRGKNEDYAFTVFESLNTTGEPLTAYETFKPRVVLAETLTKFENSASRKHLDQISNYLSIFKVGEPLQNATRDLLISFAAAETGYKLSKRLAEQRRYLKEEFERHEKNLEEREAFVQHLRDVANFTQHAWETDGKQPTLPGLPADAATDSVKLCLTFLSSLGHSVTIAPMVRFYAQALGAAEAERETKTKELEGAVKALAAFSALWRASRRGTANIDAQYREILSGSEHMPALARKLRKEPGEATASPIVNLEALKAELVRRLGEKGGIANREEFVMEAAAVPAYKNSREVSRLLLLAAYHDSVADEETPGLIKKGKPAVSPCLTFTGFTDQRNLTLEHIAPQEPSADWDDKIYENRDLVHRIGNLVLAPHVENAMVSNRAWPAKRILYQALGAASHPDAQRILLEGQQQGVEFGESTQLIIDKASHLPHLSALGNRKDAWTNEFLDQRSKRLLSLAWDELYAWLK
ncbi:DUF262 domain-containing protein [Acidovorax sp. 22279]|uniref:DUF262 domain-containing protein n=1 Tax=Acidovorax sp. 22279 TaxID=3453900 RepID=UPI003F85EF55